MWEWKEAEEATGGRAQGNWRAHRVSIDSRAVQPGDLFVAIRGERFDGHGFVAEALAKGAAAAMVTHVPDTIPPSAPLLIVTDTLRGLEDLGRFARKRTRARIIGVTGSVGKTSTKEALTLALTACGLTFASRGNLNNHIGVPLNLANLPRHCDFAIFEMGMNHAGEISALTKMVRPDVAIITTVEAAHLEFFPSEEAIADAKAEIFDGLTKDGIAILNRDNRHGEYLAQKAKQKGVTNILFFGTNEQAHCRLLDYRSDELGSAVEAVIGDTRLTWRIGAVGRHWALTTLSVLAAVHALGADLAPAAAALANFREPEGRGRMHRINWGKGSLLLVDDSYNASPASMRSAFAKLADLRAHTRSVRRTVALLGDMLELGEESGRLHAELLTDLERYGIDRVCTAGPLMRHLHDVLPAPMKCLHATDAAALSAQLPVFLQEGDLVLVKGSHGSKMYEIARNLIHQQNATEREHAYAV